MFLQKWNTHKHQKSAGSWICSKQWWISLNKSPFPNACYTYMTYLELRVTDFNLLTIHQYFPSKLNGKTQIISIQSLLVSISCWIFLLFTEFFWCYSGSLLILRVFSTSTLCFKVSHKHFIDFITSVKQEVKTLLFSRRRVCCVLSLLDFVSSLLTICTAQFNYCDFMTFCIFLFIPVIHQMVSYFL